MARPLRIEYPDAWYHVMNRGRHKEKVFIVDNDYLFFLNLLEFSSELFHVDVAAYCLMPNHYHLLIHTPGGNLSRFMRHLGSVYTQTFNRKYNCDGQLFRGRYKAILIEEEQYLLYLIRYIQHNPLKEGLSETLDDYPWSSHHGYVSDSIKWNWLYKKPALYKFNPDSKMRKREYLQYMAQNDTEELEQVFSGRKLPSILGSTAFIQHIKEQYASEKIDKEVPESKVLLPAIKEIINRVCAEYNVDEEALYHSKRGTINESRNVAVYLIRHLRGEKLGTIAVMFHIKTYSAVSSILLRTEKLIKENKELKKQITFLKNSINKSQEQI
ncbi:MAG: transposase [Spirochaetes bacterium]|nr:transposase [Spirochaetota bacterium]